MYVNKIGKSRVSLVNKRGKKEKIIIIPCKQGVFVPISGLFCPNKGPKTDTFEELWRKKKIFK